MKRLSGLWTTNFTPQLESFRAPRDVWNVEENDAHYTRVAAINAAGKFVCRSSLCLGGTYFARSACTIFQNQNIVINLPPS
jgi:hypothetical protein